MKDVLVGLAFLSAVAGVAILLVIIAIEGAPKRTLEDYAARAAERCLESGADSVVIDGYLVFQCEEIGNE